MIPMKIVLKIPVLMAALLPMISGDPMMVDVDADVLSTGRASLKGHWAPDAELF